MNSPKTNIILLCPVCIYSPTSMNQKKNNKKNEVLIWLTFDTIPSGGEIAE